MRGEYEYTPWYHHDGGPPKHWPKGFPVCELKGRGIRHFGAVSPDDPGFHWRWGYLKMLRIYNPAFGYVTAYRFRRPKPKARKMKKSKQVEVLREIAAGNREPAET